MKVQKLNSGSECGVGEKIIFTVSLDILMKKKCIHKTFDIKYYKNECLKANFNNFQNFPPRQGEVKTANRVFQLSFHISNEK